MLRRTIIALTLLCLCSGQRVWTDGKWKRPYAERFTTETGSMAKTTSFFGTENGVLDNVNNYDNGVPVTGDTLLFPEGAQRGPDTNMDAFNGTEATGDLTLTGNAGDGELFGIQGHPDTHTYRFKTVIAQADDVLIGGTPSDTLDNLIAAINGGAGSGTLYHEDTTAHADVSAVAGTGDVMDITAQETCTSGNSITLSISMANGTRSGPNLTGGVNFVFALIFVGEGFEFDIGTLTASFETNATKIVHQGPGAFYFTIAGTDTNDLDALTDEVIVNSNRRIDAIPAMTVTGIVTGKILYATVSKGYGVFSEQILDIEIMTVSYRENSLADARAEIAGDISVALIVFGGTVTAESFSTASATVHAGNVILNDDPSGLTVNGGLVEFNGTALTGAGSTATQVAGGILDFTQSTNEVTVAELFKAPNASVLKSDDLVTITLNHDLLGGDTP